MQSFTTRPSGLDIAHATILAALRHYQATAFGWAGDLDAASGIHDIATNGGRHQELSYQEVDLLCNELNCGVIELKAAT